MLTRRNVSNLDQIISPLLYVKKKISAVVMYYKAYSNFLSVMAHIIKKQYPIEANLRNNNQRITFDKYWEVTSATDLLGSKLVFDISTEVVTIPVDRSLRTESQNNSNINVIELHDAMRNGDVVGIFRKNIYRELPIKGKVVIDVGANIGDSSIYFALNGAKKVIGLEPFPKIYHTAQDNVRSNNLSDKIIILLAGCCGPLTNSRFSVVDPQTDSSPGTPLVGSKNGVKIPLLTLESILNEFKISPREVILKMDCEGCEYDSILSADESTLKKFGYILIEYHYGYKNLKEKLEKCGFNVTVTRPVFIPKFDSGTKVKNPSLEKYGLADQNSYDGYIYAEQS
jgi:FkbM family methyltransferase